MLTLLICILLTLVMLVCLARSSKMQTAAVRLITQEFSKVLQTDAHIDKIEYTFPNRLSINGIYVEDLQADTLLFVDTLDAHFSLMGFFKNTISFHRVNLSGAYANAYMQEDSLMNYDFLLKLIPADTDTVQSPFNQTVQVRNVSINHLRARYCDYRIADLNALLSLNRLTADTIDAIIRHIDLREAESFQLNDLRTHLSITPTSAELHELYVELPHSVIDLSASASLDSADLSSIWTPSHWHESHLQLYVSTLSLTPSDIKRFVPAMGKLDGTFTFAGQLRGTLSELTADNIKFDYKQYPILRADATIMGLPEIDTCRFVANVEDLMIDHALLQDFLSDLNSRPYQLPQLVRRLGKMHYKGTLDGKIDSLMLDGLFTSKLGNITTLGRVLTDTVDSTVNFTGTVATPRFALGRLLDNKDIGNMSMQVQMNADADYKGNVKANVKAAVPTFQYKNYTYRQLSVVGNYSEKQFDGHISINDKNLSFDFTGLADLSEEMPMLNFVFRLNKMHLGELHLSDKYADSDLSGLLTINGSGNSLDNINGYVYVDSLHFNRSYDRLFLKQLRLTAETDGSTHTALRINSDYLNAGFTGNYRYSELPMACRRVFFEHLPRMLSLKTQKELSNTDAKNDISFYAYFKRLDEICSVLELPIMFEEDPTIKGFVNERKKTFGLQATLPDFYYGNQHIKDITVSLDNQLDRINLALYMYKFASDGAAGEKMGDVETFINAMARNDSLYLNLDLQKTKSAHTEGSLRTATHFSQYAARTLIDVHILPTTLMLADSLWNIDDCHIVYSAADTALQITDFRIGSADQYIYANGCVGTHESDSLYINLSNIVLDYLLEYTDVKRSIIFGGAITGTATAYSLLSNPMFEAELWMDSATINNSLLGDAHAIASLNRADKTIEIWGAVTESGDTIATVDGLVAPEENKWDLYIYPDSANLAFINYWTKGIIEDISGRGYGWVHVLGRGKITDVEGKAYAKDATIGVPILGTHYHFSDSVTLDIDAIRFDDIVLHDDDGNNLYLQGVVRHEHFLDFSYDLNLDVDKAKVMDLPATTKDMFYGKIYSTATLMINGNEQECRIRANARTEDPSSFSFVATTASTARDNSFITFVDHRNVKQQSPKELHKQERLNRFRRITGEQKSVAKQPTKVLVDLQIEATPAAEVCIIIDPRTGDQLKGRGEGNIKFSYDVNSGDIGLFGTYTLNSGSFNFTYENLLRKSFTINSGSTITFNGDPTQNLTALSTYGTTCSTLLSVSDLNCPSQTKQLTRK